MNKERVQGWKRALGEVADLAGWHLHIHNKGEAEVIEDIVHKVLEIRKELLGVGQGEELLTESLVGQITTERNLESIWGFLMNHEISSIGVYGMGGIGKTTIATHIHNRLLKHSSPFGYIYWVTVSKESSIFKLQNDIAKVLHLDLSSEDNERKRAAKLYHWMERRIKKFVLILDNMWEIFPLKEVGIPLSVNGGKLLLTTRIYKVCLGMKCEKIVKVDPLPPEESWDLFVQQLDYSNWNFSSELKGIVKSVVKECAGLPLAIVTVASGMRGTEQVGEWRNALNEFSEPGRKGLNNDMENHVFKLLQFSYDRLGDEILQQCLLYCSLFPENYNISKEDLIAYWIGEGLIDEMYSRQAEVDRGNAIINRLINTCLLESAYSHAVKMHDVIRDMALTLVRENPMFMVSAGVQLRDFPSKNKWSINLDCVSLMKNDLDLGCLPNSSPNCPRLKTLLLQKNKLKELPDSLFSNMWSLTVLDLSELDVEVLPNSISKLKSLRMLLIRACFRLKGIPFLGNLQNLLELNLSGCVSLRRLPNGLERLTNLKVLDLSQTVMKGLFPSAVLKKLTNLQALLFYYSEVCVDPEALIQLRKLESIMVNFADTAAFNFYVKSQHLQRLLNYDIGVGSIRMDPIYDGKTVAISQRNSVGARKGKNHHSIFPKDMKKLQIYHYDNPISLMDDLKGDVVIGSDNHISSIGSLENGAFSSLQILSIEHCPELKPYLFTSAFTQHCLPNIQSITVSYCGKLEDIIIATEEEEEEESLNGQSSQNNKYPTIVLPKLLYFKLDCLPNLTRIYSGGMVCPSLEKIAVLGCGMLKSLPFSLPLPSLKEIETDPGWCKSLEWGDPTR